MSRAGSDDPSQAGNDAVKVFDHWEPSGTPYLTDGHKLYRYVGGVPHGTSEIVALEDCQSLKILLFSLNELRALDLRAVDPIAGESEAPGSD